MSYDIIGDIHGHSDKLTALLQHMGYHRHQGAWRHPGRTAVFVGDFIDRGPGQLETIRIVREMIDAGSALAVMGNHEFNAIAWSMPDPDNAGQHLRRRNDQNRHQHAAFLAAMQDDPALHAELVEWFLTLPLWLELPGINVVHACWHPGYMAELAPLLKDGRRLDRALVIAASRRGTMEYRAIEGLTKGLEVLLPDGHSFADKAGVQRREVRVTWWDAAATRYRQAAIMGEKARDALPDLPVPADAIIGYGGEVPVFFGHYWWSGVPAPLMSRVACVDYSAGNGGPLVGYRWDGESVLDAGHFVTA